MSVFKTIIGTALSLALVSCSDSGNSMNENPFGESGSPVVSATYTSNADTVFLSWTLTEEVEFDHYVVADKNGKNSCSLDNSATGCVLTHIPYNENVTIGISFMSSAGEELMTNNVIVNIDGYDTYIASKIIPDSGSVTEGDGMYSIYLEDGRSIFLMGDSYTGVVSNGKRVSGNTMYRNTYSVYNHATEASYALCEVNGEGTSAAVPEGVTNESSDWYWPGHGFVVGNDLYIFQELMYSGDGPSGWNFYYAQTDILQYSLPDLDLTPVKVGKIPYEDDPPTSASPETPIIHFGAAALNDLDATGYLYIYAQVDIENDLDPVTEVYAARTTLANLYTSWEFYNGSSWSSSQDDVAALSGLDTVPISSQFNVTKIDGKYVLLAQNKTWNSGEIYTFTSSTPWGPWGNKTQVYQIPAFSNTNWYTYNAMIHPQFEKDGMVLVSFNVNTSEFSEQSSDVESYRPKFFWVEKDMILN